VALRAAGDAAVSLLLSADEVAGRSRVARTSLAPLAESLRADLLPLLERDAIWFPPEKARLTRSGGRCPKHGVQLDFDPWQPREHRCPLCQAAYHDDGHYRWWIMNYQLWLAERAAIAATLHALTDDARCGVLAADILGGYCARYRTYPNRDNVLGPTRLFFSTYLESIWLVQLSVALDLLEARGGRTALGDEVRSAVIRPSVELIASYNEGLSNRQVYNNAAMAAGGVLLDDEHLVARAMSGEYGIATHLSRGLLADGTWYEGENYHLFAHRGLWYGVRIAEAAGRALPVDGVRRFRDAFATPFATALPDFTFPSRRDSQYKVSLRQWRLAESCELGLARGDDDRLIAALAELYRTEGEVGDTGRARSTADAERNVPPVRLSRTSLGWKSLLCARPELPPLVGKRGGSVNLAGQGLAVLRRNDARTYVALDYGESGGGHGHPDRLNLWLVAGNDRILEDVGTGAYVDPSLHWYRSTLAHNAPLADGRSQWRAAGTLMAYDDRGNAGWVSARADIAPGVTVERSIAVMEHYLVDEVRWAAQRVITFDLPCHVDAERTSPGRWRGALLVGGKGTEDGFDFVSATEHAPDTGGAAFAATVGETPVRVWATADAPHEWWRCVAPGPPGEGRRRFLLLRARARQGCVRMVWAWSQEVATALFEGTRTTVALQGAERHEHAREGSSWLMTRRLGQRRESLELLGGDLPEAAPGTPGDGSPTMPGLRDGPRRDGAPNEPVLLQPTSDVPVAWGAIARGPVSWTLGAAHYRRSEESWVEAGQPSARVGVGATGHRIVVEVEVPNAAPVFAPRRGENTLDNEHADTNSDGVQLYLGSGVGGGGYHSWLLVPDGTSGRVRVTPRAEFGTPVELQASARLTGEGWWLRAEVPRDGVLAPGSRDFTLDVIVNEITRERERRRGQLVLSGGEGEWVYLRGDRQDPERALACRIADD